MSSLAASRFACKKSVWLKNPQSSGGYQSGDPAAGDPPVQQPLNSQANTGVLLSLLAGFKS
jgi:hypothetical protein